MSGGLCVFCLKTKQSYCLHSLADLPMGRLYMATNTE